MKEIIIEVPDNFGKTLKPEKENCEIKGELVRCNDCTYLNADTGICIVGIPHGNKDTFYCAYGKMR